MSILIKGEKMPDCCTYCDYIGLNKVADCGHYANIAGRAPDCPLVEVPPHGRLIDADRMHDILEYVMEESARRGFHQEIIEVVKAIDKNIDDIPTVIESEEEK